MLGIETILQERFPNLTQIQLGQFRRYFEILVEVNQVMNLTAITEEDQVAVKHFADSLTLLPYLARMGVKSLADIGTGAGFPGIPLKIACPALRVTLIDSLEKRVGFLNRVIEELGLEGISAIHARAEDAGRDPKLRSQFDVSVARAVAPMNVLAEYCMPFVRKGGHFIAMKGPSEEAYDRAISLLGGTQVSDDLFDLDDMQRRIICIRMDKNISTQYPRKAGIPKKKPL